jgi:hypothetical protein
MTERGEVPADAVTDLTDLLFVLTSFPVFSELTARGRTKEAACALIQAAAGDAIRRASSWNGTCRLADPTSGGSGG